MDCKYINDEIFIFVKTPGIRFFEKYTKCKTKWLVKETLD